jgi:hypothetical protein
MAKIKGAIRRKTIMRHLYARHAVVDECSRDSGLRLADVFLAKQKLPVQVGHVNRIQIDHVNVLKTRERQVFDYFAPEPTGAHAKHLQWQKTGEMLRLLDASPIIFPADI